MKLVSLKRPAVYVPLAAVLLIVILFLTGKITPAIILVFALACFVPFILVRAILRRSHVIWRVRNRLIVTYGFVGAVPIILILVLAWIGTYIVVSQVATYLVTSELAKRSAQLEGPAHLLANASAGQRAGIMQDLAILLRDRAGLEILVTGNRTLKYPAGSDLTPPAPGWNNYTGVVLKDGSYYCMSLAREGDTQVVVLEPLGSRVIESLVPGIGAVSLSRLNNEPGKLRALLSGEVPKKYNALDIAFLWANPMEVPLWDVPGSKEGAILSLITRTSAVLRVVFGAHASVAAGVLGFFIAVACLLALVEAISVVVGVTMTRTFTGAVQDLYEGTLRIGKGDFSHRIPVKGNDQLADLGSSFNNMTEQVGKLVVITKAKERLESELTIASEVQSQLFPRRSPPTRTIQLIGSCQPARSASGDYYDYLCMPDGKLALAIGDVAGKGIAAALLMASIQSIMRTQLAGEGRGSTADMVAQLNRQLYASTSAEKYATFFFGLYDENSRVLTYTNAGHLSPLLVCGGSVSPLEVTGTVVGLFPSVAYEEQTVHLCPGDMLIAYTDGITEPENEYGEEFGTERLTDCVLRSQHCEPMEIVAKVMESVKQWSTAPELPDDMTVMVGRGIA